MSDYYIGVDYEGQPYIEHIFGMGSMIKRKNAKYVARIKTAKGHYRYFYTDKEWSAYLRNRQKSNERKQAKIDKAKEKAENGTKVSIKQYLTGGREREVYKAVKKNNAQDRRNKEAAKKKAEKAAANYVKAASEYREKYDKQKKRHDADALASMQYPYLDWNPTGNTPDYASGKKKKMEKARSEMLDASSEFTKASKKYADSTKSLETFEKRYESTSLPGQIHKFKRKAKNTLKRNGSVKISEITDTPLIYVKKSK